MRRESERARGWLTSPQKMAELAQRLFEKKQPFVEWDDLFLYEKAAWEDKARKIVVKTITMTENVERMNDPEFGADDLIALADG